MDITHETGVIRWSNHKGVGFTAKHKSVEKPSIDLVFGTRGYVSDERVVQIITYLADELLKDDSAELKVTAEPVVVEVEENPLECRLCGKVYKTQRGLDNHKEKCV